MQHTTTRLIPPTIAAKFGRDTAWLQALQQADPDKTWPHESCMLVLPPPAAGETYEQQYRAFTESLHAIQGLSIRPNKQKKPDYGDVEVVGPAQALLQAIALQKIAHAYRRLEVPITVLSKTRLGNIDKALLRSNPQDRLGGARFDLIAAQETDMPDYHAQLQGIEGLNVMHTEGEHVLVSGTARALCEAIAMPQTAYCRGAPFMQIGANKQGYVSRLQDTAPGAIART